MSPDTKANIAPEEEIVAKKQEVVDLLNDIDRQALQNVDDVLNVAVSYNVSFIYNGDHFGLHAFKRLYESGVSTRGVVLRAHRDELPIPHNPAIDRDIVTETAGRITEEDDHDANEVGDPKVLERQIGVLRFLKEQLPGTFWDSKPLKVVPDELRSITAELWNSEPMVFERARNEFYEAANPLRRRSRRVEGKKTKGDDLGEIVTRQTKWVTIKLTGKPTLMRYQEYYAYSNGDWTEFERLIVKDPKSGQERTYLEFCDISRIDELDLFGTHVKTARAIKARTKILKAMTVAFESQVEAEQK